MKTGSALHFICIYVLSGSMKRSILLKDFNTLEKHPRCLQLFSGKRPFGHDIFNLKGQWSSVIQWLTDVNFQHIHPNFAVPFNRCSLDHFWFLGQRGLLAKKQWLIPVEVGALSWDSWCCSFSWFIGLVLMEESDTLPFGCWWLQDLCCS